MKEVKITFYAHANEEDIEEIKKVFDKYGADIILSEVPELKNIGSFELEVIEE